MKPTDVLKHEHKIVLAVLDGAEREAKNIQVTGKVDTEKISKIVDFLRTFVDKCHHSKEERKFFPRLQERGMPGDDGPIAVMLHEHTLGRNEVAAIADALGKFTGGDASATEPLAEHLLAYVKLLRGHIAKLNSQSWPSSCLLPNRPAPAMLSRISGRPNDGPRPGSWTRFSASSACVRSSLNS